MKPKKLDPNEFVKCPDCDAVLRQDDLEPVGEVWECSGCQEIHVTEDDAEVCCEDEVENDNKTL